MMHARRSTPAQTGPWCLPWASFAASSLLLAALGCTVAAPPSAGPEAGKRAARAADAHMAGVDASTLELRALLLMMSDQRFIDPVTVASAAVAGPDLRRRLALTLGRIKDPRGGPTLQSLAADESTAVRRAAVLALGELGEEGHPEAVNLLLGAVADPDLEVGRLAVEGLGKSGASLEKVVEALLDAPSGEILARLIPSLFRFDTAAAVGWARQALDEPELRAMAVYGVARNPRVEALPLLRPLAQDDDPWIRSLVARALGRVGGAEDLETLRRLWDDAEPGPVIHALRSARQIVDDGDVAPPDAWRPRLLELLDDPRLDVRMTAIEASSAWLLDEALGARLERFVSAGSIREQELALGALAEAGDPRVLDGLGRWSRSQEPVLRIAALRAAALSGVTSPAVQAIEDPGPGVRAAAYDVLLEATDSQEPASGDDLTPLEDLAATILGDEDYVVRSTVLNWAARRPVLRFEILAQAFEEARRDTEPDVRLAAIRALRVRGEIEATEKGGVIGVLEKIAKEADYLSRREAGQALVALGAEAPKLGKWASRRTVDVYRKLVARAGEPARYVFESPAGNLTVELFCDDAPLTCLSFRQLAEQGFYDGLKLHRIVPDFVVQGGDPRGDGAGGPGYTLRDEINTRRYGTGALGMAHAGPDTAGSQFFVTITPQPHLDGAYTVFGRVVDGLPVLRRWVQGQKIERVRRIGAGR